MDIRKEMQKTYLNLLPPPPTSLKKLPDKERKEVTDYIFEHAKQTYKLIKEDAKRYNEYKEFARQLALSSVTVIFILLLVIAYLTYKLNT